MGAVLPRAGMKYVRPCAHWNDGPDLQKLHPFGAHDVNMICADGSVVTIAELGTLEEAESFAMMPTPPFWSRYLDRDALVSTTCPSWPGPDPVIDIRGCGTEMTVVPDEDGWVECPRCGLQFDPVQAYAEAASRT